MAQSIKGLVNDRVVQLITSIQNDVSSLRARFNGLIQSKPLTADQAQNLYGPAAIRDHLQVGGKYRLNASGLIQFLTNGVLNDNPIRLNLLAGSGASLSQKNGDVTISATGSGGTVTAVTASSPLASSGGGTPNISIASPIPIADGGTGTTTPALVAGSGIAITGSWPGETVSANLLTTKGDVWGYSTGNARIPVGSNGQVLTADSTQTAGVKWAAAGGGSSFPLTVVQEAGFAFVNNTSFTVTFPQTAAGSGNTLFMIVSGDQGTTWTVPSGWTMDINQAQANYSRIMLMHATASGQTSATYTSSGTSSSTAHFFEIQGSHALDQSATGGNASPGDTVAFPSITPTANSVVFAMASVLPTTNAVVPSSCVSPNWRGLAIGSVQGGGGRSLSGFVSTVAAANVSTLPPALNMASSAGFFGGAGVAYATFSIL